MSKNVILFLNKHQVFYNLPVWGTKEETKNSQTLYSDIEKNPFPYFISDTIKIISCSGITL